MAQTATVPVTPTPAGKQDNQKTAPAQKPRGRQPGQESRPADEVAIERLSKATSRVLWFIAKNPSDALGTRLARCARAGVERSRAEKALMMVEDAVAQARTQFTAAYDAPARVEGKKAERPTINL